MEAQELRIGNVVNYRGKQIVITAINEKEIYYKYGFASIEDHSPIQLTAVWIDKSGVNYLNGIHNDNFSGIITVRYNTFVKRYEVLMGTISIRFIDYVHQLQNIFYELTGETLNIKL